MENTKRTMSKVVQGAKDLLTKFGKAKEKIVIGKDDILNIIPFSSEKIFLDEVTITGNKVTGKFLVTQEACAGHEIGGQPIFRAVDIVETGAQLLGVWASQFPELKGGLAFLSEIDFEIRAKFIKAVTPGKVLTLEITEKDGDDEEEKKNPKVVISGRPGRAVIRVIAEDISVKVDKDKNKSAVIPLIKLGIFSPKSLAK